MSYNGAYIYYILNNNSVVNETSCPSVQSILLLRSAVAKQQDESLEALSARLTTVMGGYDRAPRLGGRVGGGDFD